MPWIPFIFLGLIRKKEPKNAFIPLGLLTLSFFYEKWQINKIKHSKDMTAGEMKNTVIFLIQMFTDGLTLLVHGNNLLNQTAGIT